MCLKPWWCCLAVLQLGLSGLPEHSLTAVEPNLRDVEYARVADRVLTLDLYQPTSPTSEAAPVVVWVHGGAWRSGSKSSVPVLHWLNQGFAIASVEYRLSPEARFPAQIHDIKGAIRYLRAQAQRLQLDPTRVIVAGASAGGHLAALTGVSNDHPELEGNVGDYLQTSSAVQGIVSFYGAANLQSILAQSTEHGLSVRVPALDLLLGGQPEQVPELAKLASPTAHVDRSDPPLWLVHGDADPQMPPEQSRELFDAYQHRQLPVQLSWIRGGVHGGPEFFTADRLEDLARQLVATVKPAVSPVRLLFAGSSSTYWNDLPNEIAKAISGEPTGLVTGRPVTADIVGRSGSDIRVYLDPDCDYQYGVRRGQTFLDKVRDEKFDYVVLMTVCRFIMGDGADNPDGQAHRDAISQYCAAIRQAGGEPVFYEMGWGTTDREAEGRARIKQLAREHKIRLLVPCSTAWARVRAERPAMQLQHPRDSSHPGDLGHFLNMACFYAAFVQHSPAGKLPRQFHVWPHLSKEEKEQHLEELEAAYAKFQPDAYQARLPEWMRRNAGAGYSGSISEDDAQYLERVAWETWQALQADL